MSAMEGRRRLWTPPSVLLLLLVLSAVDVALLSAPVSAKCLARLDTHPAEFDVCKRGTYCFLFLAEPPMVIVDGVDGAAAPPTDVDAPPGIRSPFPCADAGSKFGLTGASFDLHGSRGLWPSNTDLCVYAGSPSECTFSAMVAYLPNVKKPGHPAYGMALGTAGMLVQVVDRLPLAVPSIPIYEDQLFLVQRKSQTDHGTPMFVQPLDPQAWTSVGVALAVVYFVILLSSAVIPHRLNAGYKAGNFKLWCYNFVRNTVGGDLTSAEAHWAPTRAVFVATPWVLAALVLIFYEGAFIAEQLRPTLTTSIRGLGVENLCHFTVKTETATEDVFLQLANTGSARPINLTALEQNRQGVQVWNSCTTIKGCLDQVARAAPNPRCPRGGASTTTDYYVTWGAAVRHAFRQQPSLCDSLEVVDLRSDADGALPIQQFDLGWMFANLTADEHAAAAVPRDAAAARRQYQQLLARRNEINAGFLRARMDGTTRAASRYFGATYIPCAPAGNRRISRRDLLRPLAVLTGVALGLGVLLAGVYPWLATFAAHVDGEVGNGGGTAAPDGADAGAVATDAADAAGAVDEEAPPPRSRMAGRPALGP